jgi:hypothetical protein
VNNREDEQFENYLKQFRVLAPKALPIGQRGRAKRRPWQFAAWAAAAAGVAVAAVLTLRLVPAYSRPHDAIPNAAEANRIANSQPLTLGSANDLLAHSSSMEAAIDQVAFKSQVTELSKGEQSALAVLSKEKIKL